ncbi:hypothetical protein BKA64DRAFT_56216 [Cadophora sp. MPI-SDFR-AT-0126]|nr:hypothetical protein BKA64DRAFT_56216 [Leotiomycetes sp. MPI-SDFR-AT-0126]
MATLTNLPTELFIQISRHLHSIDEVKSLFLTCKRSYAILSHHDHLFAVLRNVIVASPVYNHDAQLCRFTDISQNVQLLHTQQKEHEKEKGRVDDEALSCGASNKQTAALIRQSFYSTGMGLHNEHVWTIVNRWNAVKAHRWKNGLCEGCVPVKLKVSSTSDHGKFEPGEARKCERPACRKEGGSKGFLMGSSAKGFPDYYRACMKVCLTAEIENLMSML